MKIIVALALAGGGSLPDTQALAQVMNSVESDGRDIVVTARRREERLQDVPVAITAVTGAELNRASVVGLLDVRRISPSLNVSQSAGGGRQIPLFTIRGQRQGQTLSSADPSVGVYVGDQLFKRTYGLDQIIFDMGSVEVLKGPQGTLFGLNTTGGNVVFRPNLPANKLEGSIQLGIGNYDYRAVEGYLNLPLSDGVALRVAGQKKTRDGYMRNVINEQDDQDLDGSAIRATLKIDTSTGFQTILTGSYLESDTNGTGVRLIGIQRFSGINGTGVPAGPFDVNCSGSNPATCNPTSIYGATGYGTAALTAEVTANQALGFYQTRQNRESYARTDPAWNVANTTSYKLSDIVTIKNIISYRAYKTIYFEDFDGSALDLISYGNYQKGREFSNEFQTLGDSENLNWIAGAYFNREKVNFYSFTPYIISPRLAGILTPFRVYENVVNISKSLFASGTQTMDNIVEGLSITLGGRYTWDKRKAEFGTINNFGYAPGQPTGFGTPSAGQTCAFATDPVVRSPANPFNYDPATCFVDLTKKFARFTYSATVDWKIAPGKLVYFAHRKGYRSGGWNTSATIAAQLVPFGQETVFDFEVGAKLDWRFDNGMFLRTNFAAYKQNYSDIQRLVPFVTATGVQSTNVLNAASATIKGLEFETTFAPARWIEFGAYASHVDPAYDSFIVTSPKAGVGQVDIAGTAPFSGVPRWQFGVNGTLRLPRSDTLGEVAIALNYYHQSSFRMQDNPTPTPFGVTPRYGLLNGRIDLDGISGSGFKASFFVNNLLDRKYALQRYSAADSFGQYGVIAGAPRMYGLELRYSFGR